MLRRPQRWLGRLLGRSADPSTLALAFGTPEDFAAFLDDPRAYRKFRRLRLRVAPWHAVSPEWSGPVGPLAGLTSQSVALDSDARTAVVELSVAEPVRGYDLVRAAYSACYPTRQTTGWGGQRVAVSPGAAPDLRWQPGGGLRPAYPRKAPQKRYTDYDVRVDEAGEWWLGEHPAPALLIQRPTAPGVVIDPKVHRPLERRQPSASTLSARARIEADRLLITAGSQLLVDAPAGAALTATDLLRLTGVSDLDAAGLGSGRLAGARVAELAAYGAVVHDAAAGLQLHPDLAALVSAPFTPAGLLDHMYRSQAQVRAAIIGHTRAFTQHELPTISVILSTQRPTLLPQILEQLAAQDHSRLEVVVGCHGFRAPARDEFSEAVQKVLGPILEFPSETLFGDVLAGLSAAASGDFIAKVDDDDWYGPHHLTDLLAAWTYSEAELVGKKLALVHFESDDTLVVRRFFLEGYRWQVAGGASIIAKHDLTAVGGWRSQRRAVDRGLWTRIKEAGGQAYACTGPGYVHVRHADPHTWAVDENHFRTAHAEQTLPGIPPAALGLPPQFADPQR